MVGFLREILLNMKANEYILKQEGCDDCIVSTSNAKNREGIERIKDALRNIDLECEQLVLINQEHFSDEWESIDKGRNLLRQLLDEIELEDI